MSEPVQDPVNGAANGAPNSGAPAPVPNAQPNEDWRTLIPDESIRSNESIKNLKAATKEEAISALAKQFIHAQSQIGKDKVLKPQADWTPDQVKEWRKSVGISAPETAEGYDMDLKPFEGIADKDTFAALQKLALDAGLETSQFKKFAEGFYGNVKAMRQQEAEAMKAELLVHETELKKTWGTKYEENVRLMDYLLEKSSAGPAIKELLKEEPHLLKHSAVAKLLVELGQPFAANRTKEGFSGAPVGQPNLNHSEEVKSKIASIRSDPRFMNMVRAGGVVNYRIANTTAGKNPESDIKWYDEALKELRQLNELQTKLEEQENARIR